MSDVNTNNAEGLPNKAQALYRFWHSFGLEAYDSTVVLSEGAHMPYITYTVETDSIDNTLVMSGSLWYRSMSWEDISLKTDEISRYITNMNPPAVEIEGGRMYVTKGRPFSQRMSDEDPYIRRMVLNIEVEFFTEY